MLHLLVGASDTSITPYLSGGLAVTIVGIIGVLARRFLGRYDEQARTLLKPAYERVDALEREAGKLRRDKETLIRLLRRNNIDIPTEVFGD